MDIFVICIYALTLIIIGIRASGGVESLKDYAASTKKYSVFPLTATMCSALIGGGFSIGNADISASTGVGNSLAMLGFCVGTLIVAVFIVPKINIEGGNEIYSLGSLMRNSYGDISGVVSSIFSFLFCVCVLAVQISALGGLVCAFTGWTMGFSSLVGVLFIMVYSLVGGMKSVVSTDILQFLVLCVGVPLLTVFSLKGVGGVDGMVEAVPHHYFNPLSSMTVIEFASLFITFMIGETLVPPVVQRLYIGEKRRDVSRALKWSSLISALFFFAICTIGICSRAYFSQVKGNVMLTMINTVLPNGIRGLLIASLLAAVMSTADSQLNCAVSSLMGDTVFPLLKNNTASGCSVTWARICGAVVCMISLVIAMLGESVMGLLRLSYMVWSPAMLVPVWCALRGKRGDPAVFIISAIIGVTSAVIWRFVFSMPLGIDATVVGTCASGVTFAILLKKTSRGNER